MIRIFSFEKVTGYCKMYNLVFHRFKANFAVKIVSGNKSS